MKHAREPQGRHRYADQRGRHRTTPQAGRHRQVRPRYGRIALAAGAAAVTVVAVLGSLGVLTSDSDPALAAADVGKDAGTSVGGATGDDLGAQQDPAEPAAGSEERAGRGQPRGTAGMLSAVPPPANSGTGRRIVFSESQQRIWLIGRAGDVERTYLGSGSVYDNLDPGTYHVYSRSRHAIGVDDSGTMEYFVRFTQGDEGAAIGFHSIPVLDGEPVQTRAELGTPQSHGCIRQARKDAIALWRFAPIGTTVVVTP